jgi:hypothetical protein
MGLVPFLHRNAPGVRGVTLAKLVKPSTVRRQRFQQRPRGRKLRRRNEGVHPIPAGQVGARELPT